MMGGALRANSPEAILAAALFMLAAFVSILIHELGHAITGLRLGGGRAAIALTPFGGLAFNQGCRFDRTQRFWMIAAGPGAGFAFFVLLVAVLCLLFDSSDVLGLVGGILFDIPFDFRSSELLSLLREKPFVYLVLNHLLWINFWWGIINLLPVLPLDGGQIADLFVRPQRRVFLLGVIAAGAMAVLGFLWLHSLYVAVLFGYLAWRNYQNMREVRWP